MYIVEIEKWNDKKHLFDKIAKFEVENYHIAAGLSRVITQNNEHYTVAIYNKQSA